jgi:hypothetical protein
MNFSNRFLEYASEGVLAFYILHQTVIIILGYHIVQTDYSILVKYISINVISFALIVGIYETIVKRFAVLRVLFGMRPLQKKIET